MSDPALVSVVEAVRAAMDATSRGEEAALVTVIEAPSGGGLGGRLVVLRDTVKGSLGDPELDLKAAQLGRLASSEGSRGVQKVELAGATWGLYVESQSLPPELLVVGAGHIARSLSRIGAMAGFRVTVIDDRSEYADPAWFPEAWRVLVVDFRDPFRDVEIGPDTYVVLVTRAHKYDYDCILQLLELPQRPAYLGMIGSRRRVRAAFEALLADGVDASLLETVHAPIGLDIAAETPDEISIAIAAELIAIRRGGAAAALADREGVLGKVEAKRRKRREAGEADGG